MTRTPRDGERDAEYGLPPALARLLGRRPGAPTAYRETLSNRWERDEDVRVAYREWRAHVERHHGDVFAGTDRDPREAFRDVLTCDFVVSRLQDAVAECFGLAASNPDPTADASAFSVRWDDLHAAVADERADDALAIGTGDDVREAIRDVDAAALGTLYEAVVPRETRLLLGEYYTPPGVAELALWELDPAPGEAVLDPGCGAGVFLTAAVDHRLGENADRNGIAGDSLSDAAGDSLSDAAGDSLSGVLGIDLNPVAVRSARLALVLSLVRAGGTVDGIGTGQGGESPEPPREVEVPVRLGDAVGLTGDAFADVTADVVVGNPPWLTWDRLTEPVKARWRDGPIEELDLFPHRGAEARLGFGNDDLAVAYAMTTLDRYLAPGGRAGFVLKRDLRSGPAGRAFRRLAVGDRALCLSRVHDFADLSPFGGDVGADAALYLLEDDRRHGPAASGEASGDETAHDDESSDETAHDDASSDETAHDDASSDETAHDEATDPDRFPVPLTAWGRRGNASQSFESLDAMRRTLDRSETDLRPADPGDPADAWVRGDAERRALGDCAYEIRHGVKDDAKEVFTVDSETLERVESDHVYPYLRSKHVVKYGLFGHDRHLVPLRKTGGGDEEALARSAPRTHAYLRDHRERLRSRGSSWFDDDPFYDLFGLGPYTWADYKVVWCRLGFKPHFAVVSTVDDPELGEKTVVPGDHFMFVGTDDADAAHYLCALLNAAPYQRCLRDVAGGGKASLSKSVVSRLSLPAWRGTDRQRELAALSREAHDVVPEYVEASASKRAYNRTEKPDLDAIQADIDRLAESFLAARGGSSEDCPAADRAPPPEATDGSEDAQATPDSGDGNAPNENP